MPYFFNDNLYQATPKTKGLKAMKIASLFFAIAALTMSTAFAQTSSNSYAIKIASDGAEQALKILTPMMNAAFEKFEQDVSKPGVPASVKIYLQELRNAMNKESFAKVIADDMQRNFSDDDFLEIQKFQESALGKKLKAYQSNLDNNKMMEPILKEACARSEKRLIDGNLPIDDKFKRICGS